MKRHVAVALLVVLGASLALAQGQTKVEFANYYVVLAERGPTWVPQTDQKGMDVRLLLPGYRHILQRIEPPASTTSTRPSPGSASRSRTRELSSKHFTVTISPQNRLFAPKSRNPGVSTASSSM